MVGALEYLSITQTSATTCLLLGEQFFLEPEVVLSIPQFISRLLLEIHNIISVQAGGQLVFGSALVQFVGEFDIYGVFYSMRPLIRYDNFFHSFSNSSSVTFDVVGLVRLNRRSIKWIYPFVHRVLLRSYQGVIQCLNRFNCLCMYLYKVVSILVWLHGCF